jgi:hypothetical protein
MSKKVIQQMLEEKGRMLCKRAIILQGYVYKYSSKNREDFSALPACLNVIACMSFCLLAYSLYSLHWSLVLACIA